MGEIYELFVTTSLEGIFTRISSGIFLAWLWCSSSRKRLNPGLFPLGG
jgi:hypothetical protein